MTENDQTGGLMWWAKRYHTALIKLAAFIVALSVIVGAAFAVYNNRGLFGFKSSHIGIRPFGSTQQYLTFVAENTGNASGSIGRVTGQFIFQGDGGYSRSNDLRLHVMEYEKGQTVVAPGSTQTMRVNFSDEGRLRTVREYLSRMNRNQEGFNVRRP